MEINSKVKQVIAIIAMIDDTEEQIINIKAQGSEQIKRLKDEYEVRIQALRTTLKEQHNLLNSICSPEYETLRVQRRDGSYIESTVRERVARYIGELFLNPTPDEGEVKNG